MEDTILEKLISPYDEEILEHLILFLNEIGIPVIEKELDDSCFLPGLFPKANTILIDRKRLKYPGDILHEAGHVAVTEVELRPLIGTSEMLEKWPRPGDELAAILWSYAAICHLNIPPEVVFHSEGYKNDSQWLIEQFENGNYIGLPLMEWMGFCDKNDDKVENTIRFPLLKKWQR